MNKPRFSTRSLTTMALLCAVSILLVYLVRIPMFLPFLEYDPADISIFVGTLAFGPGAGLLLTVVVSVLQGLLLSSSGWIGIVMHIVATGSFVIVAGLIHKKFHKTTKGTIVALIAGFFTMVVFMILWNIILTPLYMGVSREMVIGLLLPAIIPFNVIKAGLNAILAFVLYQSLKNIAFKKNA